MTIEKLYPWHQNDYKMLLKLDKRLPNAILFCGEAGLGVYNLVTNFIATILCDNRKESGWCNKCNSCILFSQNSHPDLHILSVNSDDAENKSKNITVDMVRQAINFAYLSPHLAKYKVVLIDNANLLNQNSANALLKILEEPPSYVLFILITDSLGKIIPTIRSRCQKVVVRSPFYSDNKHLSYKDTAYLNTCDLDSEYGKFWSAYYNYMPLIKPEISDDELLILLNTLITPSIDNIFSCTDIFNGKAISFSFTLEFIYKWLVDINIYKNTNSLEIFYDYADRISPLILRMNNEKLFYLFDEINFLLQWVSHPLNYKLHIENILFQYQVLFS